jgi:hypothetical protein
MKRKILKKVLKTMQIKNTENNVIKRAIVGHIYKK